MRDYLAPAISGLVPLCIALTALNASAQDADRQVGRLLGPVPTIKLNAGPNAATKDEKQRISVLIDRLTEIKDPDYGFAPLMGGTQFAPINGSATFEAGMIMVDHDLKTSESLQQLVALGPKAIRQLLTRLTDKTPTKLVMEHGGSFGGQWYAGEVPMNTANPTEQQVHVKYREFLSRGSGLGHRDRQVSKHQVTIGDVCFVVIGQIVNRGYQSARYQPTACRVINSPTHDPEVADVVRAIWADDNPAQKLIDSLLLDLHTKDSDEFQCGAAMRLLFYFPTESADMIAKRIAAFDLGRPATGDDWTRIYEKNGVRVDEFLKAVRACPVPAITDALLHVVKQTDDPGIFHEAITEAVVKRAPELVFDRMKQIIAVAPPPRQGAFGGEYQTLIAAARHFPDRSKELFEIYRGRKTLATLRSTIHALDEPAARRQWMTDWLSALLDDKTDTGEGYGPEYDTQPIRICDEAAKILADNYLKRVRFEYEENPAHLDRQIAKIKRVLAGETAVSFAPPDQPVIPRNLPQRKAKRVVEVHGRLGQLYPFSSEGEIWAGSGSHARSRYVWETLKINTTTGDITGRIPLDNWKRGVNVLENGPADRRFSYHCDEGGDVLVHDARTGRLLKKIATPFHDGVKPNDPLQVRNTGDMTLCGVGSEWIIAVTEDGTLHSIEVEGSRHRIEWKLESANPEVIGVHGTSRVLLEGVGGKAGFEVPIRVWDQSTRALRTIEEVPHAGWRAAWGDLAWNDSYGCPTLWNLAKARELKLPDIQMQINEITCTRDQSRIFILRGDGSIEVFVVTDGDSLKPLIHLVPPTTEAMEVSMVLGDEKQRIFWLGRPPARADGQGRRIKAADRAVIAIFDYGAVND